MRELHKLWTKAVGQPNYDKAEWMALDAAISELKAQIKVCNATKQSEEAETVTCCICQKPNLTGFQIGPNGAICMECFGKGKGVPLQGLKGKNHG